MLNLWSFIEALILQSYNIFRSTIVLSQGAE